MNEPNPAFKDRGASGAAGELLVAAHFLRQGYSVYRSESPSAPFDLVIYKDGLCLRVEVKTASVILNVNTGCRHVSVSTPRNDEWDLLAIVLDHEKVFVWGNDHSLSWMRDRVREHVMTLPDREHWKRDLRRQTCYHRSGPHTAPDVSMN